MHEVKIDLVLSLLILGATLLALVYHIVLYAFAKDRLLLHYLAYLVCTSVFLFCYSGLPAIAFGPENHLAFMTNWRELLQMVYLTSYFNFIVQAVKISKKKETFFFRYWKISAAILMLYGIGYTIAKYKFPEANFGPVFTLARITIFAITGLMLYQSYKLREIKFQLIILYGCTIYLICGLTSFVTNLFDYESWAIWPIEWLMIGSFLDIVFF